jgi:hypothetical protein
LRPADPHRRRRRLALAIVAVVVAVLASGTLRIRAAEYEPGDSHCCPSRFRTTTIRWDGSGWTVVDRVVTPA